MRPFRMFFGIAVAAILLVFVARVAFFAFIIAAIMSITYAIFRRIRDFITYDRNGEPYFKQYEPQLERYNRENEVEPLFFEDSMPNRYRQPVKNVRFIEAI